MHIFYAYVIYQWLGLAIVDYTRRCNTMKALDGFIKKNFTYVDEDGVGSDPAADKERTNSSNFDGISLLSSTSTDAVSHFDEEGRDFDFSSNFSGTAGSRVRAKSSPPLLSLNSAENVNSFFMARRILKNVGEVYHLRMQLLAFCILLRFSSPCLPYSTQKFSFSIP